MNIINKNKSKTNMSNKNKTLLIGGLGLLGLGGIFAYFTDTETKDNKFTVGNVDIQLIEDKWDAHLDVNNNEIPDIAETITPLKSIEKDPLISNVGTNDAWVYLEVKVPIMKNVVVADTDGNKLPAGDVELFSFTPNSQWTEIGTKEIDDAGENMVYVYGYNTSLKTNTSTPTLFDSIKFANIIQGQGIETLEKSVAVTAKAIQTDGTGTMIEAYNKHFKRGQVAGDQYQEFELTLNTNGVSLPDDFKTVYEKGTTVELPTLTKTGYNFEGWYTNSEMIGTPITSIEVTEDLSLYAKFNAVKYNITYNLNGGTLTSGTNDTYTVEGKTLPVPTRTGYKFLGWDLEPVAYTYAALNEGIYGWELTPDGFFTKYNSEPIIGSRAPEPGVNNANPKIDINFSVKDNVNLSFDFLRGEHTTHPNFPSYPMFGDSMKIYKDRTLYIDIEYNNNPNPKLSYNLPKGNYRLEIEVFCGGTEDATAEIANFIIKGNIQNNISKGTTGNKEIKAIWERL